MEWHPLESIAQLDDFTSTSHRIPCLLFKHSTRCNISFIALLRLEEHWHDLDGMVKPYFLDLIRFRNVSDEVSRRFEVPHESPQVLLIHKGFCIFDASHLDISVAEIRESLME